MAGLVPAISLREAPLCQPNRDHRDKPGDDNSLLGALDEHMKNGAGLLPRRRLFGPEGSVDYFAFS
jgi:hypothetical protein